MSEKTSEKKSRNNPHLRRPDTGASSAAVRSTVAFSPGQASGFLAGVQAKFVVGKANDPFEREADQAADFVTSGRNGSAPTISSIGLGGLGQPGPVAQQLPVQRQDDEMVEDESAAQGLLLQRREEESGEEELPAMGLLLQRQEEDLVEEEPPPQGLLVQRQDEEMIEDELPSQGLLLQRQEEPADEELSEDQPGQALAVQRCGCGGNCTCDSEKESPHEKNIQRQAAQEDEPETGPSALQATGSPSSRSAHSLSHAIKNPGPGEPLNPRTKHTLESGFGVDLGDVRVHSDGSSRQTAHALKARAFTHGKDIWLGPGESQSDTRLMAHEATHVVQQTGVATIPPAMQRKQSEREDSDAGCANCREDDEAAVIQRQLDVNAERLYEPQAETVLDGTGSEEESAAEASKAETMGEEVAAGEVSEAKGEEDALNVAETNELAETEEGEAEAPASPGGEAETSGRRQETSGVGERACEGGGGGINAECYREGYEEPEEEPDEQPNEPEATEAKEEMEAETPEEDEEDVCPVEEAVTTQADAARPSEGVASEATGAAEVGSGEARSKSMRAEGGEAEAAAPETQAMADAASANESEAQAAHAPIDAAISRTEAQRSEAVAAYETAMLQLEASSQNARQLTDGLSFAPIEGAEENDRARQNAADDRVNAFFSAAANQIDETAVLALENTPLRLGTMAESIKADIAASIETEKAAISVRIAETRVNALTGAKAARQHINAEHHAAVSFMETETAAAVEALTTAHAESMAQVDEQEIAGLDEINRLYAESREAHEAIGATLGQEAHERGEEYYAAYENCKIYESDGFFIGHLTDRRAEAQQNAARETAKGYRESLEKAAKDQAKEAMKGRKKDRCAVISAARQARNTLDELFDGLVTSLNSGLQQAIESAGANREQMIASVDDALAAVLRTLDEQERSQRQAANDAGYLQQVAIEQAAHAAAASIQTSVGAAVGDLADALAEARAAFAASPAPEPAVLEGALAQAEAALGTGLGNLTAQVEGALGQAEARLLQTGLRAREVIFSVTESNSEQASQIDTGFADSMTSMAASASASYAQQKEQYSQQAQSATEGGLEGFAQAVLGFAESVTTIQTNVESALGESEQKLEDQLRENKNGIDCEIQKQAMKAASKEQPAWKTVVAVILIIAVIIVVALVIGPAVIGAVGAAASALGAGAAATAIGTIVGGAIVGAVASTAITVINNWRTGQNLTEGLVQAAITGAIGGALGAGAGLLIGKFVAGQVAQFALNVAADGVLEIGTQLVTVGEISWDAFAQAMVISIATAGFGEVPKVKRMQARMQQAGARAVPGRRVRADAETKQPSTGEPEGASMPARAAEAEPTATRPTEAEPPISRPSETERRLSRTGEAEIEAPSARRPEPDEPANRLSDAELANTKTPTKVGDADHSITARRVGDEIELWICSSACGNVKSKIDEMIVEIDKMPNPPRSALELRGKLGEVRTKVESVEQRIKSGEASKSIVDETGAIAREFKLLGEHHRSLGDAINNPRALEAGEGDGLSRAKVTDPIEIKGFDEHLETRQVLKMDEFDQVNLRKTQDPEGQQAVYILRDSNGNILKVGKTSRSNAAKRFAKYRKAGEKLGIDLILEVTPLKPADALAGGQAKALRGEDVEGPLRSAMEAEGQIMPWDNTGGRLERPGPGVPFERIVGERPRDPVTGKRTELPPEYEWSPEGNIKKIDPSTPPRQPRPSPPDRAELISLLTKHRGNVKAMAKTLETKKGALVPEGTLRRWLSENNLSVKDFQ